jgi:hypothetical protein
MHSYSESIEFLYSGNTFSLSTASDEMPTIDYLSYYFLPQRLVQISDLHIQWELDKMTYLTEYAEYYTERTSEGFTEGWFRSWEALSKLTGLRRLHINLEYTRRSWDPDTEKLWNETGAEILSKVKDIKAPRDFVIYLPDRRCTMDIETGNPRCTLKLRPYPDRRRNLFADVFQ